MIMGSDLYIDVREIDSNYVEEVNNVKRTVWGKGDPYKDSLKKIRRRMNNPNIVFFGAFHEGKLIGLLNLDMDFKSTRVRLIHCSVLPEHQGNGVSRELFQRAKEYCIDKGNRGMFVFINPENRDSVKWIESLGFERAGECKYLYRGDRKSYIYYKKITSKNSSSS